MKRFGGILVTVTSFTAKVIVLFSLICTTAWALPHASFTANKTSGCSPLNVLFNNTSTGAVSYYWDFGNGNSSTLLNPSNLYTIAGNYTVTLIATDAGGNKDSVIKNNLITVVGEPTADFYSPATSSCLDNNSYSFISTSTGAASWLWDFGDGTFSSLQNPTHSYVTSGTYTITLLITNSSGCTDVKILNQYITIYPKPQASFTENSTVACNTSQPISFTSTSTGATTWQWDFGDSASSSLQNPVHTYSNAGTFPVTLIVANANGCTDTVKTPAIIYVGSNNWAGFNSDIDSGCAPMTVNFRCTAGGITSILWNFGDGNTSAVINPSNNYKFAGSYTVSMTVTNINGCTSTSKITNYIVAGVKPTVNFTMSDSTGCTPFAIGFTSHCQNATSYVWDFGDGTPNDSSQSPVHTYTGTGIFNVSLTCSGASGCTAQTIKYSAIHVSNDIANFMGSPRMSCPPMTVNFTDFSQGNKLTYFWKFGDGSSSTQKDPSHIYANAGSYDVTLIVKDSTGCTDTLFKPGYIQVINPAGNYITPDTTVTCAPLTTQFHDNTAGAVSWLWNFGDSTTSALQDPLHTYSNPGIYTVSLTTQLSGGCNQTIKSFRVFNLKGGIAKFSVSQTQCPPYCVTFIDSSQNAVSWLWNFGDGTISTTQNPTHCYVSPGWYSVSLTITTPDGCTISAMYSNCVYFTPFLANFFGVPVNSGFPETMDFYANSVGATGWLWSFGDGGTSTAENPSHTYTSPGNYQISLTITLGPCTLTYKDSTFYAGTGDSLIYNPTSNVPPQPQSGCAPLFVTFNNNDAANVSWVWDFGDGTKDSSSNTSHNYNNAGVFTVTLTTVDTSGIKHINVMDSLVRVAGPVAEFSYIQGSSCQNTIITFKDSSLDADHWLWNFGDGTTDTIQNPTHQFTGHNVNYIVSLTIMDSVGCSSSLSTSVYSSFVNPILVAQTDVCNTDTVNFNTSLQNYSGYLWTFGDGDSSTAEAPNHVYATKGVYPVTLTVTDNSGCSQTYTLNPSITVNAPVANFSTNDWLSRCDFATIHLNNLSTGADYYWWDFGDSTASNAIDPVHTYLNPGSYTITLTAYSGSCVSTMVKPNYVNVYRAHADFSVFKYGICLPMTIQFTDLSTDAVSWHWSFGDDSTSNQQNPIHTYYVAPGGVNSLTIIDSHGCTDSISHNPFSPLEDHFTASVDTGCLPLAVNFTNQCVMAISYYWEFGDGATSTQADPQHIYTTPGSYNVTLIIQSAYNCSDTLTLPNLITVLNPHADFISPDLSACAPSVVNFTDLSKDATSWLWDFGDSTGSTNQNPSHIYNTPGVYNVKLIVSTRQGCSDTLVKTKYIHVLGPVTSFSVSATGGCDPFTVQFTDLSKNAINQAWSFGDGYSSTDTNPSHTYTDTGSFTVALVTHDSTGCSSFYSYPQKIIVHGVPKASFFTNDTGGCQPYLVTLTNTSTGQDSTLWDFGDGTTSNQINPTHIYLNPGSYTVTLIASTQFGCTDTFRLNTPIIVNMTPVVHFSAAGTAGCTPLIASFKDSSGNLVNPVYAWSFGNGQASSNPNPNITFINPGFYNVSLTITNSNGCSDSLSVASLINVFDTIPPAISPIYSVSVTSNTTVEIIWGNNAALNLGSYQLFRYNPVSTHWDNIYTNLSPNNSSFSLTSSYSDSSLNTLQNTYSYKLLTTDICGKAIGLDQLIANTTINISTQTMAENIKVYWTPYEGCTLSKYTLYRTDPGATPQLIATLSPDSLSYLDTTLRCPYGFSYRVTANDLDGRPYISNSDTAIGTPVNSFANQVVDVVRTTVVDNQFVLTEWKKPVVKPESVVQYDLYRSSDNANFFYLTSIPSVQTDYTDYNVDVQKYNYYYKVLVINQCDISVNLSDISSSILLSGEVSDDYVFRLRWTDYKHWANGVDHYVIEKQNADGSWTTVGKVNGTTTGFEDR